MALLLWDNFYLLVLKTKFIVVFVCLVVFHFIILCYSYKGYQ